MKQNDEFPRDDLENFAEILARAQETDKLVLVRSFRKDGSGSRSLLCFADQRLDEMQFRPIAVMMTLRELLEQFYPPEGSNYRGPEGFDPNLN